ncbi:MAG TPA: sigma-70 family RNA polymerase sigma factor [Chitinophagaceae bacterium]|nr:sigma-70 family RNA polymerase sigma factor [Chitinophagaceae bacterium]
MVNRLQAASLSDEEVLQRFRVDQDKDWIGILFLRYSHLLFGVCLKYLKNAEDARDGLQQVFLKVLSEMNRHQVNCFKAWIYQVTRNYCLMQIRKEADHRTVPLRENQELEDLANEALERRRIREVKLNFLEIALQQLPAAQRDCLNLFYLEKKSYQQIAERTGQSLMQVKSHIQNGKRKLKLLVDRMMEEQPPNDQILI